MNCSKDILIVKSKLYVQGFEWDKKILEENRAQLNTIEYKLTNLIETTKSSPTSDAKKIKSRNNMLEIVDLIL